MNPIQLRPSFEPNNKVIVYSLSMFTVINGLVSKHSICIDNIIRVTKPIFTLLIINDEVLLAWNRKSNYPFSSAMFRSAYIPPSVARFNVSNKQPVWFQLKPVFQIISNQSMIGCYVLNFSGFSATMCPADSYVCWEVAWDKNRLPDRRCTKNPAFL